MRSHLCLLAALVLMPAASFGPGPAPVQPPGSSSPEIALARAAIARALGRRR